MKCFNHETREAVGLCKHCSKGLCRDCYSDLGHGLACKNTHEREVENINSLIENNKRAYEAHPRNKFLMPIFYLFMGTSFMIFGFKMGFDSLTFILGIGFVVCGIVMLINSNKLSSKITTKYDET